MTYAVALRASEICGLTWDDVIRQNNGKVQLSVFGKGSKRRTGGLTTRLITQCSGRG
jgi:site-specific recombinase XerC